MQKKKIGITEFFELTEDPESLKEFVETVSKISVFKDTPEKLEEKVRMLQPYRDKLVDEFEVSGKGAEHSPRLLELIWMIGLYNYALVKENKKEITMEQRKLKPGDMVMIQETGKLALNGKLGYVVEEKGDKYVVNVDGVTLYTEFLPDQLLLVSYEESEEGPKEEEQEVMIYPKGTIINLGGDKFNIVDVGPGYYKVLLLSSSCSNPPAVIKHSDPAIKPVGFGDFSLGEMVKVNGAPKYHGRVGVLWKIYPGTCIIDSAREKIEVPWVSIVQKEAEILPFPNIQTPNNVVSFIISEFMGKEIYISNIHRTMIIDEIDSFSIKFSKELIGGRDEYFTREDNGLSLNTFKYLYPNESYVLKDPTISGSRKEIEVWLEAWKTWFSKTHPEGCITDLFSKFPILSKNTIYKIFVEGVKVGSSLAKPELQNFISRISEVAEVEDDKKETD